jgi:hypothetical protein
LALENLEVATAAADRLSASEAAYERILLDRLQELLDPEAKAA